MHSETNGGERANGPPPQEPAHPAGGIAVRHPPTRELEVALRGKLVQRYCVGDVGGERGAFEVVDVRDLGDLIVAALRALGHGAGSDLPFEDTIWLASRWRRGKCVWWRIFNTADEALEAAGLRE
jgi:hypothetical protein